MLVGVLVLAAAIGASSSLAQMGRFSRQLEIACRQGNMQEIVEIFRYGRVIVTAQAILGATYGRHKDILQLLFEHGVNPNARDNYGENGLLVAARSGHPEIARMFLDAGGDIEASDFLFKQTALLKAARYYRLDVMRLLTARGANVNHRDIRGNTPLHATVSNFPFSQDSHRSAIEILLAHGADTRIKNNDGNTPLDIANILGEQEIAALLVVW